MSTNFHHDLSPSDCSNMFCMSEVRLKPSAIILEVCLANFATGMKHKR